MLISTLKVLGHLIFKRIPPGNMTSDSRGLCRQEREIRSKFYTKRCSFITTFSPTEGSKLATALVSRKLGTSILYHIHMREYSVIIKNNAYVEKYI